MKAKISAALLAAAAATAAAAVGASAAPGGEAATANAAQRGAPRVDHMVVFRGGRALRRRVVARRATVAIDGRRCAVPAATPLAALLAMPARRLGRLGFHDYGSCSRAAADAAGLFVRSIRGQVNTGLDGWVYKVGARLGTAGAADPAGPFGAGRLRAGDRVVWFYCVFADGSCQRTLELRRRVDGDTVETLVSAYDDGGEGGPLAGARVVAVRRGDGRRLAARTGEDGRARLVLPPGTYALHALARGAIRAFPKRARVR